MAPIYQLASAIPQQDKMTYNSAAAIISSFNIPCAWRAVTANPCSREARSQI